MELFPNWQYNDMITLSIKELYALRDIRIKRKTEERKAQENENARLEKERQLIKARNSILRK